MDMGRRVGIPTGANLTSQTRSHGNISSRISHEYPWIFYFCQREVDTSLEANVLFGPRQPFSITRNLSKRRQNKRSFAFGKGQRRKGDESEERGERAICPAVWVCSLSMCELRHYKMETTPTTLFLLLIALFTIDIPSRRYELQLFLTY